MLERIRTWADRHDMLGRGDRIVVSVSGGPDSVALLHVLHSLAPAYEFALHVFHLDHGLRGEASAGDARYVQALANRLSVPCTVVALQPGDLKHMAGSLQANARTLRYAELERLAAHIGANKVALGHNRDDQAETVCMRFLRGAGTHGLAGISPVRHAGVVTYIRPLLNTPRCDIEQYCRDRELSPRLDESNNQPHYLRNRLRLELLPHLAATYNPAIGENLGQLADVLRAEDQFLDQLAAEAFERCRAPGEGVALNGAALLAEPLALARRVVRLAAKAVVGPTCDLGLEPVTQVLEAAPHSQGSRMLMLPNGVRVFLEYGVCRFFGSGHELPAEGEWPLAAPGVTVVPPLGLQVEVLPAGTARGPMEAQFDAARLPGPLRLRTRRPGDRIWPTGMEGSKKVQDMLVDAKVPKRLRDRVPLLTAGDEVLWVIGYRLDRRFLATAPAEPVWYIRVSPGPSEHLKQMP
jgi:tRNA(Ile)-lysidine synthase